VAILEIKQSAITPELMVGSAPNFYQSQIVKGLAIGYLAVGSSIPAHAIKCKNVNIKSLSLLLIGL
jgi:hypothetical protein